MVAIATILLGVRIYCRTTEGRKFWWDDGLLVLGCALLIAGAGCLSHAIQLGHMSPDLTTTDPVLMTLLMPLAHSCHLLSLLLGKISFGVALLRFSSKTQKIIIWVIIVVVSIALPIHAVVLWRPICGNPSLHALPGACWDQANTGYFNIATSSKPPVCCLLNMKYRC
jgi:hypothetical protein